MYFAILYMNINIISSAFHHTPSPMTDRIYLRQTLISFILPAEFWLVGQYCVQKNGWSVKLLRLCRWMSPGHSVHLCITQQGMKIFSAASNNWIKHMIICFYEIHFLMIWSEMVSYTCVFQSWMYSFVRNLVSHLERRK